MTGSGPLWVHLVRHGKVASHRGDIPVTPEGYAEIDVAGQRFAALCRRDDTVQILSSPTRRSRETAEGLYRTVRAASAGIQGVEVSEPRDEWAIRNPDLFLAGARVEMVSSGEAMAEQVPASRLTAREIEALPFYGEFFTHPDRIGFWLSHDDPPGENMDAVGRRIIAFCRSLRDRRCNRSVRYICVTHSPILRAVLCRYLLTQDPGEPEWVESIDLMVSNSGLVTMTYRDRSAEIR